MIRWLKAYFTPKPAAPPPELPPPPARAPGACGAAGLRFGAAREGGLAAHRYGDAWERIRTTESERFNIGADGDRIGLLLELAGLWHANYYLLYVLIARGNGHPLGRYESPALEYADLRALFAEFGPFFNGDGRHQLWIGSPQDEGLLVYDHHDLIYAYGDLPRYQLVLERRQFVEDALKIPSPHVHRFQDRWDAELDRLMKRYEWRRTDLQPGDDP